MRFLFIQRLDALGENASYAFEAAFVFIAVLIYRRQVQLKLRPTKRFAGELAATAAAGFFTFVIAVKPLALPIPFDLKSPGLVALLLIAGPLLEEGIFRLALWFPVLELVGRPPLAIAATTALFSFGHFFAYFTVPDELKGFIVYQTFYTLGLGAWLGYRLWKAKSWLVPLFLHIAFNFGFYLAGQAW